MFVFYEHEIKISFYIPTATNLRVCVRWLNSATNIFTVWVRVLVGREQIIIIHRIINNYLINFYLVVYLEAGLQTLKPSTTNSFLVTILLVFCTYYIVYRIIRCFLTPCWRAKKTMEKYSIFEILIKVLNPALFLLLDNSFSFYEKIWTL